MKQSPAITTQVFETIADYRNWRHSLLAEQKLSLGFVPTMGALHEGHLSLIRKAQEDCQMVVVSIFVNPTQFSPHEDFDKYPRPFASDLELCQKAGVSAVFHPGVSEIYTQHASQTTIVQPPDHLINKLCGLVRPGHFVGVATVVLKLFNIIQPNKSFFGEKDFQQLAVIKNMVSDLDLPVEIVPVTTAREKNGLAISSRNVYLDETQRKLAPKIYETLCLIRNKIINKELSVQDALSLGKKELATDFIVQYLEACTLDNLEPIQSNDKPFTILVAAKLGNVRLIDNLIVK
jgi:pantoate--beta-alanine ligase